MSFSDPLIACANSRVDRLTAFHTIGQSRCHTEDVPRWPLMTGRYLKGSEPFILEYTVAQLGICIVCPHSKCRCLLPHWCVFFARCCRIWLYKVS